MFSATREPASWKYHVKRYNQHSGFTLIEVLVALVLLAIGLSAMVKSASENTLNTAYLRDKYLASLVATNKLNEMRVLKTWPGIARTNGYIEMVKLRWRWDMEIKSTPDANLRRVILRVSLEQDEEKKLFTLNGYLSKQ